MNTNTSQSDANTPVVIQTRYVWGPTVESCMTLAQEWVKYGGWTIVGNPAPMTWNGTHGTGVSISRAD